MITALDPKTALVLIDMQNAIAAIKGAHAFDGIVEKTKQLIDAFREKDLPIVFVNVNPIGQAWTQKRADQPSQMPKDEEGIRAAKKNWEENGLGNIISQLQVKEGDIMVTKHTWSAFPNTNLQSELQKRGITGIVLAGVATSIGVEGTARDASVLGYNLTFANDAMTDMFLEAHDNSIARIFPRIGEVDTTEAIVAKVRELA
ncbi:isochorismatase family protein [Mucilaginibacter ximonensis]|uniref:Isochorismatase family protein n=1 Tax=Mucilaginibacter ximonensis TaxID=538021 RepID=A0ABW5YG69_9SPHI